MRATALGSVLAAEPANAIPKRTPLTLLWAFCKGFWSIFTQPYKTYSARVLLFQPAWVARIALQDSTWVQDLGLFLFLHAIYSYWTKASGPPSWDDLYWLTLDDQTIPLYIQVFSLLGVCGLFAGGIVFRGHALKPKDVPEPIYRERIDEQVLPPLLLASKTTHSRLFPEKHAFSYSYLLVGVPVGVQGRISKLLSVDSPHPGWFSVDPEDYLFRGDSHMSLSEKLQKYLRTQSVTDRDYAFAYLVTAPRFLGYSFNPVSFWYLYDADIRLKYMILEVNNTFDERRMYLLRVNKADTGVDVEAGHENDAPVGVGKQLTFSATWKKDFHVSPFNSRKGSYSLRATDPLAAYEETGHVRIDNTIVLRSSKEHPKIVARIWSDGEPKDPATISSLQAARFILAWCWVGFATFPRILWEASKLYFRRRLHVWYRPEVVDTSIGRPYTADERELEAFFKAFLTNAVSEGNKPLRVIYEPAHAENEEIVLYSPAFTYEEDHKRTLSIKVLTPAFYSRFAHYEHAKEAFYRECLEESKSCTATLERPELLDLLLDAIEQQHQSAPQEKVKQSWLERARWAFLRRLRCPPAASAYSAPDQPAYDDSDTKASKGSELDTFVLSHCEDGDTYRRIVTKLFLAERFGFGIPALLVAIDLFIRTALLMASMVYSDNTAKFVDVFRPRQLDLEDVRSVAISLLLANSVHIWSLFKG
jgi:DUF1365 family protein